MGAGGALMSRESDGMCWSSFGHLLPRHILVLCLTNTSALYKSFHKQLLTFSMFRLSGQ